MEGLGSVLCIAVNMGSTGQVVSTERVVTKALFKGNAASISSGCSPVYHLYGKRQGKMVTKTIHAVLVFLSIVLTSAGLEATPTKQWLPATNFIVFIRPHNYE